MLILSLIQVLETSYEAQQAVAPFLEHRALRRIIQTFTNDENQDFDKWATNPLVRQMLAEAKDLLDSGKLSEKDVEQAMLQQVQVINSPFCADSLFPVLFHCEHQLPHPSAWVCVADRCRPGYSFAFGSEDGGLS